jgi:recombination protein RecA
MVAKLNKEFGPGSVYPASESVVTKRFTSGSLSLDISLGGGWPANNWVEIYGMESHGKTFVTLKTIAANQKADPNFNTFWLAAENFDTDQATALGVDLTRVTVMPTQKMEKAFTALLQVSEGRTYDCIVLDSYPALIADEEAEKDMDEFTMAVGARLVGKFFRKAGEATRRNIDGTERPMLGIFINQIRDNPGGYSPRGTATTTPGGKGKNFAFYVRLEVKRGDWITENRPRRGEVRVGQTIKAITVKNKSAAPQQVASIDAYFRKAPIKGFERGDYDILQEIVTYGVTFGFIEKAGKWYKYEGMQWNGKLEMLEAFREMPEYVEKIRRGVLDVVESGQIDSLDQPEE